VVRVVGPEEEGAVQGEGLCVCVCVWCLVSMVVVKRGKGIEIHIHARKTHALAIRSESHASMHSLNRPINRLTSRSTNQPVNPAPQRTLRLFSRTVDEWRKKSAVLERASESYSPCRHWYKTASSLCVYVVVGGGGGGGW
jgi:hypothetical protein